MSAKASKTLNHLIAVLLITVMAVSISACSGANQSAPATSANQTAESQKKEDKKESVKFPAKEIALVVPNTPGGGFDAVTRILAPFWEKHLPGSKFVVVNKPGGDGAVAIGEVNNAEPDGHTILIFNIPGFAVNQVLGKTKYDLNEFQWIGRVSNVTYAAAASNNSPYKSMEDFKKADKKIKKGAVGVNSSSSVGARILGEAAGFDVELIPHPGSAEAVLSAIRGDSDFVQYPLETIVPLVQSKELAPLWIVSHNRIDELPDVPTLSELGYPEMVDAISLHRLMGTTPGTPPEIVDILRDSFWKVVNDPEFVNKINEYEKSKTVPLNGEDAAKLVENSLKEMEKYKELFQPQP